MITGNDLILACSAIGAGLAVIAGIGPVSYPHLSFVFPKWSFSTKSSNSPTISSDTFPLKIFSMSCIFSSFTTCG